MDVNILNDSTINGKLAIKNHELSLRHSFELRNSTTGSMFWTSDILNIVRSGSARGCRTSRYRHYIDKHGYFEFHNSKEL